MVRLLLPFWQSVSASGNSLVNELFLLFALQGFVRVLSFDKPVRHLMLGRQHVDWSVPDCHQQTYRGILNTVHTQLLK